jgi:hypothetical protein
MILYVFRVNIYVSVKYRARNVYIYIFPVSIILFHKTFVDSFLCVEVDLQSCLLTRQDEYKVSQKYLQFLFGFCRTLPHRFSCTDYAMIQYNVV